MPLNAHRRNSSTCRTSRKRLLFSTMVSSTPTEMGAFSTPRRPRTGSRSSSSNRRSSSRLRTSQRATGSASTRECVGSNSSCQKRHSRKNSWESSSCCRSREKSDGACNNSKKVRFFSHQKMVYVHINISPIHRTNKLFFFYFQSHKK